MSRNSRNGLVAMAFSVVALLATSAPVAAQTPTTTYKNMFGDDCVEDYPVPDDGSTSYVRVTFRNTCGQAFKVEWYVNGAFRGTVTVMPFKDAEGVILRKDVPNLKWSFEPS